MDFASARGSACSVSLGGCTAVCDCRQRALLLYLLTEAFTSCYQWPRCSPYRGFISLEDTSYVLEPSSDHADGAHWIYPAEHLRLTAGTCGHDFNISSSVEDAVSSPFRTFGSRVRVALTCVFTPSFMYLSLRLRVLSSF